jgi:hypothetical protein
MPTPIISDYRPAQTDEGLFVLQSGILRNGDTETDCGSCMSESAVCMLSEIVPINVIAVPKRR